MLLIASDVQQSAVAHPTVFTELICNEKREAFITYLAV